MSRLVMRNALVLLSSLAVAGASLVGARARRASPTCAADAGVESEGRQDPLDEGAGPDRALKREAASAVDGMEVLTQQMVDSVFSFGELGFQEVETQRYLVDILRKNGFTVEEGIAGVPTAFMATWGSGKPVIALGSDVDASRNRRRSPGSPTARRSSRAPRATARGTTRACRSRDGGDRGEADHGAREDLRHPEGVAGRGRGARRTKAYFIRAGYFKDVDVCLFTHVGSNLGTSWGSGSGNGLVSVEYTFLGESAHSAAAPWRGRSALDAVELMNVAGTSGESTCASSSGPTTYPRRRRPAERGCRPPRPSGTTSARPTIRASRNVDIGNRMAEARR